MKNKILAVLASVGLVASASAVEINENLSINGFIDGSFKSVESDAAGAGGQELGLDEIELNFLFNHGPVSGAIHIDDYDGAEDGSLNGVGPNVINDGLDIEQAHVTYSLDSGVSFTLGRFGSLLGFEREDPAGLYTFSRAYSVSNFNIGDVDSNVAEGVRASYANDTFALGLSLFENTDQNLDTDDLNAEISIGYTGIENVTIGIGYIFDNEQGNNQENDVLNFHASTSLGKLFLAAEYTQIQVDNLNNANGASADYDAYLVLLDYDFNDKLGAALRISNNELTVGDYDKITIAPNYALTDNLGAILEYSDVDDNGNDANEFAVELTYTF